MPDPTGPDVEAQLQALADHRLSLVPDVSPEAVDETAENEAPSAPHQRGRWLVAAAVVAVIGTFAVIFAASRDSADDTEIVTGPDPTPGVSATMYDREVIDRDDWTSALEDLDTPGTFALAQVGTAGAIETAIPERATVGFLPASTFKLLNALIILETGVLPDLDTVVPWDGVEREFASWNQDHTLRTAIQESAVWVFEDLAAQVGPDAMAELVASADYGNADIGVGEGPFWLDGNLRTSAIDQLAFLERLVLGELPFDATNQGMVVASLPRLDGPDSRISYKTGTALAGEPPLAWLVGLVDTAAGQWVFAYNVDLPVIDGDPVMISTEDRLDVVLGLLVAAGVLDG